MFEKFKQSVYKLDDLSCTLGNICIVVNMAVVVFNVIARNLTSWSIGGITDYAGFISCLIVVLCLGYTEKLNGNPKVDFILEYFPKPLKALCCIVASVLDILVGVMLAYSFFKYAGTSVGTTSMNAHLPYPPFLIVSGIGMTLYGLTVIVHVFERLKNLGGAK